MMGHLTKRGWSAKTPHISSTDAAEFRDRCRESHTARWSADVTRWNGTTTATLAEDIPITGGKLTLDSGDQIRRQLSMTVGGGEEWEPTAANDPLPPWGQRIHLYVQVDRRGGGWFPKLKLFTGPIRENIFERPSLITSLECADPGSTLHEYLHVRRKGYGGQTLVEAIGAMADAALPGAAYDIEASTGATTQEVETFVADAGQSRLEAANEVAGRWGYEVFFDWAGDVVIRRDLTDEDDASWDPSEAGPDIGDVARPVARFRDEEGGNLIGTTTSLSREGSVNGVAVNLDALRKAQGTDDLHWNHLETAGGSIAWGDVFGRIPLVETKDVHKITVAMEDRQTQRAKKLLKRRRGMVQFVDFDALPSYWVEPDDRVEVSINGRTADYFLERIELDLTGDAMRCRTRVLTTPSL